MALEYEHQSYSNEQSALRTESEPNQYAYDLIVFDFHGTLTDHQLRLIRALHHSGHSSLQYHLPKQFYQEALTRPSQVNGRPITNQEFVRRQLSADYGEEQISQYWQQFQYYMETTYIPIPNIVAVIKELMASNRSIALLTNGTNRTVISAVLDGWGLQSLSERLYSSHNTGVRKPNAQAINYVLEDFAASGKQFATSRTLLVGDYRDDIKAAHNTGVDSVLMIRGTGWEEIPIKEPRPTYIVSDAKDILSIIQGRGEPLTSETIKIIPTLWRNERWGRK